MPQAKTRKLNHPLKLDRGRPHQQSIGEGAHEFPYYQNGYYFDQDGDLLDCEHNRTRLKEQDKGKVQEGDLKVQGSQITPKDQVKEQLNERLKGKSDEEIFNLALALRGRLIEDEKKEVGYEPKPDARTDNINFILDNTTL